ncbi:DUF1716-domain-containing protein [Cutaneotrichosporon oleaginosum]|uniref:DUF1716-domain-containing protein n=1 Tax=Cutaneotrichosporon oleaginosum TaxID=879819 RepID=A0A0J0XQ30_9TREE|nr:DUF1716-domain-containing protein [Cutaneotrichosporon oleaginosum]KLT43177.1 DUF1716-domain-containing protein [Cutaneotrichosporon oleaginosum]TXT09859.1 hypothetical protein COLE_03793 [Cutaneotrichosporon oleaginosum]
MEIDKMFKIPSAPVGKGTKRRMPDLPSADILKRFKLDTDDRDPSLGLSGRAARVEDENEESHGMEAAEEPQEPHGDVDDEDDDEGGRFFGGGLNHEQTNILDIFDKAGDAEGTTAALTLPQLRRLIGLFERVVAKNAEQRGKYPDDPTKFIDSEADLDAMLKQFLPLTENPALYYPELIDSGVIGLFANLLSHENTDITVDVVQVLQELTDEDIGEEDELEEENDGNEVGGAAATRLALAQVVDELLSHSIFELLVSNLSRLDEGEEGDSQGVFHILGMFENLLTFMPPLADQLVSSTNVLAWLLNRVSKSTFDSNKQYASEILAILLQRAANVEKALELGGVETLLMVLAQYRKAEPRDGEEQEFMENIVDCLCFLLSTTRGRQEFFDTEGVELMLLILKKKQLSSLRALKVLDYGLQTEAGANSCERFVEMLGLKTMFSFFMGKTDKKKRQAAPNFEDDERIMSVIATLFSNLASDSPARLRLVAKFVEEDYEKVDRLLELREQASAKLRPVDRQIAASRDELGAEIDDEQEQEWYLTRLAAGLSALQTADVILGWICMEDDGIKAHAESLMARKSLSMHDVVNVIKERASHIDVDEEDVDPSVLQQRMILDGLINFLGGGL